MWNVFISLGVVLLAGVLYRFVPGAPPATTVRSVISSIVLNVFVPLLTFGVVSTAPIGSEVWTVPAVSMAAVVVGFVLSWSTYAILLRRFLSRPAIGSLILAGTWCNAMYLGLPISTAVVGIHVAKIPIMYDYMGMTPLLFTVGTIVCVEYGSRGERHTLAEGVAQTLRMPPLIAVVIALVVNLLHIDVPVWLSDACTSAGRAVAPLMLFSIGLALQLPNMRLAPLLAPAVLVRCVLVPVLLAPFAAMLINNTDVYRTVMLETAMPTMMLTMVFADKYGLDESVLAQAILLSTLVAILTLPIVAQWTL